MNVSDSLYTIFGKHKLLIMRFSERIGKRAPKDAVQVDTMDDDLRNGLWNAFYIFVADDMNIYQQRLLDSIFASFAVRFWDSFLKKRLTDLPFSTEGFLRAIEKYFFSCDAYGVYDFIDFVAEFEIENQPVPYDKRALMVSMNNVLADEFSAYRFVDGHLTPIVSQVEIDAVEQAIAATDGTHYKGASIHLQTALEKLSDRREPDYRNSMKEAISAVESVCQVITGDSRATLGSALKQLEKTIPLHGALKEGLLKIYGYTSDSNGIRHALHEEANLNQEDALFMLVTCSAFVNYLTVKADKATAK